MTSCPACNGTGKERFWSPPPKAQVVRIYCVGSFKAGRLILTRAMCAACRGTGKLAEVLLR